jgi:perosamine synthetase
MTTTKPAETSRGEGSRASSPGSPSNASAREWSGPGALAARLVASTIGAEASIEQAMARLDVAGTGVLLLVDNDHRLVGIVTDGDIRRHLLTGRTLALPSRTIATVHPLVATPATTPGEALELVDHGRGFTVNHLPVVDSNGRLVGLILRSDLVSADPLDVSAVIMAGGLGTRLRPLSKDPQKPALPVGNRPQLARIIERLRQAGVRHISITTHYLANRLTDYFGDGHDFGVDLHYVPEDRPLGTAGALRGLPAPRGPVLVINGDVLTTVSVPDMLAYHRAHSADATVGVRRNELQVPYGVIECKGPRVSMLRETPQRPFLENAGVYVLERHVLELIPADRRFDMTDLIQRLLHTGKTVVSFPIFEYWRSNRGNSRLQEADAPESGTLTGGVARAGAIPTQVSVVPESVPLCVPYLGGNEWAYVKECLDTNWVSSVGSYVERFERMAAAVAGTRYGVATTSGTAALHIALLLAGVRADDEVLVSTLTFIAPVNAIRYVGAWPVFVDAEPDYMQFDVDRLKTFLSQECVRQNGELRDVTTGRRVQAILPVHLLGHPVDMASVLELADAFDLAVIEDASEGLGARCYGQSVGSLADVGCLSFNGNKLITTGGGGMILTNDEGWARHARYLTTQAKDDPIEAVHGEIGYNYRLSNVLAAMGLAQLERVDAHVAAKRRIAATYAAELNGVPGITPMQEAPWAESSFWLYTIQVDAHRFGMDARSLHRFLAKRGIETRPLWQPIHKSPAHADARPSTCPVAERLNRDALSLPCSVGLSRREQEFVIATVREACSYQDSAGAQLAPLITRR